MENKQNIKDLIEKFYPYAKESLGFDHPVRVIMRQDAENAQQSLGKTAYYDPAEKLIVLYITDRHPKDVLRSFSHELVHHAQNCRGELDDLSTDDHYAKDGKGREIEKEAYLQGNFNVRDYEDNIKFKGVNEMKLTKSQLKGLIGKTIEKITEGGGKPDFLDLDKDGDKKEPMKKAAKEKKAMDEDKEPSKEDHYARSKGLKKKDLDHMRATKGSVEKAEEEHEEKTGLKKMPVKRTGLGLYRGRADEAEMDEQEALTISPEGSVELPEDVQRVLDMLDTQLASMDDEDKQMIAKLITRLALEKAMQTASPEFEVEEAHCGGKRDDDLEEQEMKPTIKGKDTTPEPERKVGKGAEEMLKVAKDAKKSEEEKAITKPTGMKIDESNDTWYNSTLYESLKTKWTKKGDK
tara:strand:- start:1067 stop:2287 length:1221 start_codon:yes stop_codon:yes gene_type:complete